MDPVQSPGAPAHWRWVGRPHKRATGLPTWLARGIIGLVLNAKAQADADAGGIRSAAGIAVFVARRHDKAAWIETGRAYERFALQATALGIRNAFINQPIEVPPMVGMRSSDSPMRITSSSGRR